jgi:hypothetical protein
MAVCRSPRSKLSEKLEGRKKEAEAREGNFLTLLHEEREEKGEVASLM